MLVGLIPRARATPNGTPFWISADAAVILHRSSFPTTGEIHRRHSI